MFAQKDFDDKDSAVTHYEKVGEQRRVTLHIDKIFQQAGTAR